MTREKQMIQSLLHSAGITINGNNPRDPHIHDERFYGRVLRHGSLGLGESYMDGWWDCEALDQFFTHILAADLGHQVRHNWNMIANVVIGFVFNAGRKSHAFEVGQRHYDLGNELYEAMLDTRLAYSCGYWKDATTLDQAEEAKLDLVCRKIELTSGQRILDIGSGWGSFIGYAAEKYGVSAVGLTVSKEQKEYADQRYHHLPVETRLEDYRDLTETFDHVVSIGMFEHVGYKNYRTFMQVVHRALEDNGLFLLHTIGGNHSVRGMDPWIGKYIFPNSMLPSMTQISRAIEGLFVVEDWHNFGADYDQTLMAWYHHFESQWQMLRSHYDERFHRMWKYYLLACAGSFRARKNQLWQIVLSKKGVHGGYRSVR